MSIAAGVARLKLFAVFSGTDGPLLLLRVSQRSIDNGVNSTSSNNVRFNNGGWELWLADSGKYDDDTV